MSTAARKPVTASAKKPRAKPVSRLHLAAFADRRRNPNGKKEAVLKTAVEMFIESGYRQTSLDDVAERLKITKPALYYYFDNKEEIYLECYRRGIALTQQNLDRIHAHAGSGLEKVAGFIHTYTMIIAGDFGRFLVRQDDRELSRKAQIEVRAEKRKIDARLRSFIEQGMADGSIRPCNVRLTAFSLAGAIHSLAVWFRPAGKMSADEVATEFARTLIEGLANRRSEKRRIPKFELFEVSKDLGQ